MTQDKAPEWAKTEALKVASEYHIKNAGGYLRHSTPELADFIALTLSQAYERGQVDMRERAAAVASIHGDACDVEDNVDGADASEHISQAIRSLPIDGKDGT